MIFYMALLANTEVKATVKLHQTNKNLIMIYLFIYLFCAEIIWYSNEEKLYGYSSDLWKR